jgi:zinc transport system substrate-binding protein
MSALAEADIYFSIGVPFETSVIDKTAFALGSVKICDTRRGIRLRPIDHEHGESLHGPVDDPHIWLDPLLVKTQAGTICRELSRLDSDNAGMYERNLALFEHDLDSINTEVAAILRPLAGRRLFVFHPSFGYFTDRYGLQQVSIEASGKEPSARLLAHLMEELGQEPRPVIFVQRQYSSGAAEAIAGAAGGEIVTLDPLSRDYLDNLVTMANLVAGALAAPDSGNERGEVPTDEKTAEEASND